MRQRMLFTSAEIGRTVGRKFKGSRRYAWKVGSDDEADFQGLRPVARFRRMMASDQMSLKRGE
jgi:hypothetical protein